MKTKITLLIILCAVFIASNVHSQSPTIKHYRATLIQTGTNAPLANVRENTLGGTVTWERPGVGDYVGHLAGAFTDGTIIRSDTHWDIENGQMITQYRVDNDTIEVRTWDVSQLPAVSPIDGVLGNVVGYTTAVDVTVYPTP